MVEITSISKKESSSFQENLTWKDIQGLSWTLDELSFELNDKLSTCACA